MARKHHTKIITAPMAAAVVFLLIALAQLGRVLGKWSIAVHGREIPLWLNWVLILAFGIMAFLLFSHTDVEV